MSSHQTRLREFFGVEADALRVAGRRARLMDHHGSRGSDVEHTVREWLRRLVEPEYTVSAGEIVDAFDTDAALDRKQQDIIVHEQSVDANAFVLPSGLRLVPVEAVAAVVEVKLALDSKEFTSADQAAAQTARLKLSVRAQDKERPGAGGGSFKEFEVRKFNEERAEGGVALSDRVFERRTKFAVFGVFGPTEFDTLVRYLQSATTVQMVACLAAGAVHRQSSGSKSLQVHSKDEALLAFARYITNAVREHRRQQNEEHTFEPARYYPSLRAVYWPETGGFEFPAWYNPSPEEREGRAALFPDRTFER